MKTYSSKSNVKRAALKAIVTEFEVSVESAKSDFDAYVKIIPTNDGFVFEFITPTAKDMEYINDNVEQPETLTVGQHMHNEEVKGSGLKIEKDREEQNGVTRPSIGGVCRKIWDFCDNWTANHDNTIPTVRQVKEKAEAVGWDLTTSSIQYYTWRKFKGIIGRQKKV